jgi:hypothetical protein
MNWNHRVWRTIHNEEECFEVKETYYNANGEICGCTENPVNAFGYTPYQLQENLERMLTAVIKSGPEDILETEGFKFAEWD